MAKIATREAYGKTLVELGEEIQDIVVLDADLSQSTKTVFLQKVPRKVFNMGIAEQNLMGTAAGFAPVERYLCRSFAVFATGRAFEQIRNSICYPIKRQNSSNSCWPNRW